MATDMIDGVGCIIVGAIVDTFPPRRVAGTDSAPDSAIPPFSPVLVLFTSTHEVLYDLKFQSSERHIRYHLHH